MQKGVELRKAFSNNILRRIVFWCIGVHVASAAVVFTLTASYSGGISTIRSAIVYVVIFSSVLEAAVAGFALKWRLFVEPIRLNNALVALVTGPLIGIAAHYVIISRFSLHHGQSSRGMFFEACSSVVCSIVTLFAFLVDNQRKGTFDINLPSSCPNIIQHTRKLIVSDITHWVKTAIFIGITVIFARNFFSFLAGTFLFYGARNTCKLNDQNCGVNADYSAFGISFSVYSTSIVSFLVRSLVEVSHSLLLLVLSYPLDFSKLESQSRSVDCTGESFVSDAIAIGGVRLDSDRYSWHGKGVNSSSSNGTSSTNNRVTVGLGLNDKAPKYASQADSGLGRAVTPAWQEAVLRQKQCSEELLAAVRPSLYGPPILPFFSSNALNKVNRYDIICRSLALQDLKRSTLSSNARKKKLFEINGKWPEIVFSSCGIIDAATLQVGDRASRVLQYIFFSFLPL